MSDDATVLGAWQLIETAPLNGTEVLVCKNGLEGAVYSVARNYNDGNGWCDMSDVGWAGLYCDNDSEPTHWMPLPPPPEPPPLF